MTVVQFLPKFLPKGQRTWTVIEILDARTVAVAEVTVGPDYTVTDWLSSEPKDTTRVSIENFVHSLFSEDEMEQARR